MKGWQIEWGKLFVILVLILCGFTLILVALLGDLPDDRFAMTLALGSSLVSSPMGYLFGNGRLATKGEVSVPTISPRDAGRLDVGVGIAWLIVVLCFAMGLVFMSYLGGAVVCGFG